MTCRRALQLPTEHPECRSADQLVGGRSCQQAEVFEWVAPAVDSLFEGYNASILAYGQTGSGKTHTMGTSSTALQLPAQHGIVPRAFARIFETIQQKLAAAEADAQAAPAGLSLPAPTFEVTVPAPALV